VVAVSAAIIAPVVPPALPRDRSRALGVPGGPSLLRRSLPLPSLIPRRTSATVYGMSALDDRGRLADRAVMRALGWSAGVRLAIGETRGLLVVHADSGGTCQITRQGHLRVPAPLRHRCGLETGDRVLLAAECSQCRLVVYPPAAIDALIAPRHHTGPIGGESA
jgi:hypothetical protein